MKTKMMSLIGELQISSRQLGAQLLISYLIGKVPIDILMEANENVVDITKIDQKYEI